MTCDEETNSFKFNKNFIEIYKENLRKKKYGPKKNPWDTAQITIIVDLQL
jgi:hypothetical protein